MSFFAKRLAFFAISALHDAHERHFSPQRAFIFWEFSNLNAIALFSRLKIDIFCRDLPFMTLMNDIFRRNVPSF